MVAKAIDLGPGLQFPSIAEGRKPFAKILADTPVGPFVTAEEFKALKLLYEAYCTATSYAMPSPPKGFFTMHERGKGYSTKCFGVEFEDGRRGRFSLDKALSAVAK
jgi:hypothetical protein